MTTPQNPFATPDKGDRFTPRDNPEWLGKLFIIRPNSVEKVTFKQDEGPQDVVEAYVAIVDLIDPQTGRPKVMTKASIGGKGLVPQLKAKVGEMVLGRLLQTPAQGEKSGAYMLSMEQSPQDVQIGMAYIAANPIPAPNAFAAPQAQAAPPSAPLPYDPWQHTQAAPAAAPQQQYAPPQPYAPAPQQFPAAPAPAAPAGPSAELLQFLAQQGINTQGMAPEQVVLIGRTFPGAPQ